MRVLTFCIALICIVCVSCARQKFPDSATVTRIKVAQDGTIFLNGTKASLEDVKTNLEQLKVNKGRVRYFRENPQGDPPTQAVYVTQAIANAGLPLKLCSSEEDLNGTQ